MQMDIFCETTDAASAGNIVSFAAYLARQPVKIRRDCPWDDSLVRLAGCDVINLAERRR